MPISIGDRMPETRIVLRRVDLLRYCGACGDFTGTHWNERIAQSVGLPDVISHGTLNIALAAKAVSDWIDDPGAVLGYSVERFTNPLVVPDSEDGTTLTVTGYVEEISPRTDSFTVRVKVHNAEGKPVMGHARVRISLDYRGENITSSYINNERNHTS